MKREARVVLTCEYCHELPSMAGGPAHFCAVCPLALEAKGTSENLVEILAMARAISRGSAEVTR